MEDYRIKTVLNKDKTSAVLEITVFGTDAEISLADAGGNLLHKGIAVDGTLLKILVEHVNLWSAERPYLYQLTILTDSEAIGERVGFRDIVVENGIVKINGEAIKFRGVNRHDSYPDTGYYASVRQMRKDLELMSSTM